METLALYQDCKERRCLPDAGGVLDQSADIMLWFRILDERFAEHRRRKEVEKAMRRPSRA